MNFVIADEHLTLQVNQLSDENQRLKDELSALKQKCSYYQNAYYQLQTETSFQHRIRQTEVSVINNEFSPVGYKKKCLEEELNSPRETFLLCYQKVVCQIVWKIKEKQRLTHRKSCF